MVEWWKKTFDILVEENITEKSLEVIINSSRLAIRSEFDVFFDK